jgi:hypothetical protein
MSRLCFAAFLLFLLISLTPAQPAPATGGEPAKRAVTVPPEKAKPIKLARFETPPVIDGKLDDAVWQTATVFKDFLQVQPGDNIAPTQPTEAYMGFDAKTLYIAFRAYEEPGKVRATVAKRDDIFNDDFVGVWFDTFNDQRRAYEFLFNPHGIQADASYIEGGGGNNEDFTIDVVMESKGVVDDKGFTVEVAIPFKSLRYEAGPGKMWGLHVLRRIQHANRELNSWMPLKREVSSTLGQAGHITGLEGIATERTLEIIPTLTVSESGQRIGVGDFRNNPIKIEPGVNIKYSFSPNLTLDAAINPDFAQVEADQLLVTTNQRFPLFFEERRPFFLEGKDIFTSIMDNVYTRQIVDPDYAVKLTGKKNKTIFGALFAVDAAPGNFSRDERINILADRNDCLQNGGTPATCRGDERFFDKKAYSFIARARRDLGTQNSLGIQATSRTFIERRNHLFAVDGRFRLDEKSAFSFHTTGTMSRRFIYDPDQNRSIYRNGNGFGYAFIYEKQPRNGFFVISAVGRSRDFYSDLGFTRRRNTNSIEMFGNKGTEPKPKAQLVSWNIGTNNTLRYDWAGRLQAWNSGARAFFNFQRQTFFGFGFDAYHDRLFEGEFGPRRRAGQAGAFFGPDNERTTTNKSLFFGGESTPSKKIGFYTFVNVNRGAFDFDFGGGPKFERVSRAARLLGQGAPQDPGAANGVDLNSGVRLQPTDALNLSLNYTKSYLRRQDTGLLAYDTNIYSLRATYQFTRFTSARVRMDYDTLSAGVRSQLLFGWTPNPGTAFYVGYNDDVTYNGYSRFSNRFEDGLNRNGRTFFIKVSYLFRRSFSK